MLFFRDTTRHVEELVVFGGFTDTQFLERSLVKQLNELEERWNHFITWKSLLVFCSRWLEIGIQSILILYTTLFVIWTVNILSVRSFYFHFPHSKHFRICCLLLKHSWSFPFAKQCLCCTYHFVCHPFQLEGGFLDAIYHYFVTNTLSRITSALSCYIISYLVINLCADIAIIL